jgi:hypothetical protein
LLATTTTEFASVTTNGVSYISEIYQIKNSYCMFLQVICFGGCATTFIETALPTSAFSGITMLPYWDDLYFYANTSQGIYYQISGTAPDRTFTIEYYCSHYLQSTDCYHFEVVFAEKSTRYCSIYLLSSD